MKVVLKEDVISLGTEGDVVDVAKGYARNYLVPKRLAMQVTPGVLRDLEYRKKAIAKKEENKIKEAKKEAKKFNNKNIKLDVETTDEGHLYGSINVGDVVKAINEQLKQEVDKKKVVLTDNIKDVGTYPVTIRIHPQVDAKLNLEISGRKTASGKASE